MKLTQLLLILAMAALAFAGCEPLDGLEDVESAQYDAEYAVPLFNSQLSLRQALENFEDLNTIYVDGDGLIHFRYQGDLLTQNSDTIFQSINDKLSGTPIPVISKKMPIPLDDGSGLDFDHLIFKGGGFVWGMEHRHQDEVEVTLTMPQITKDGEPLSFSRSLDAYSGSGPPVRYTNLLSPADLAGYEVKPDPLTDSIYAEYELIRAGGQPDTAAFMAITFTDMSFEYMEGFMGLEEHKGTDTIVIDFFDNYVKGDIYFADPTVTFHVENSFGVPTRSRVNAFEVFTVNDEVLELTGEYITDGIDFPYPELSQVGETAFGEFVFDKDNSNIDEILGSGPLAIYYDVDAVTNPDSNTSIRGFITDSSYYDVRVEVDLPLYGKSVDFLARDTFEVAFDNYDKVDHVEFKMVAENELPLDVLVQGYFEDDAGMVLDSLFEDRQLLIASAEVDAEGNAIAATEQATYIDFPSERFERVRPAKKLTIVASFFTAEEGQKSVYILDSQNLSLRMGAIFGIENE